MRAKDAEDMIAAALTDTDKLLELKMRVSQAEFVGLCRSQPIYARKIEEKDGVRRHSRTLFYRDAVALYTRKLRVALRTRFFS